MTSLDDAAFTRRERERHDVTEIIGDIENYEETR
jgi:hypothetical protein